MRLYSREEIERLRFIKRLVDDMGINLAGVQQLLEIAEVMRRIQPLTGERQLAQNASRRRLLREIDKLNELLGLEGGCERIDGFQGLLRRRSASRRRPPTRRSSRPFGSSRASITPT